MFMHSQRGEADSNGLQWEKDKPTRYLPTGIPGTRLGGISLVLQSGSDDYGASCKKLSVSGFAIGTGCKTKVFDLRIQIAAFPHPFNSIPDGPFHPGGRGIERNSDFRIETGK